MKLDALTPADCALHRLLEGNRRYVNAKSIHPNFTAIRRAGVANGQHPFAIVFGCVDSRVPPEIVFDCGLGDLLVIRTAGHVVDNAALGSIEFGVEKLGIPLIVVLGHARCGAVTVSVEAVERHAETPGQIRTLVEGIKPAIVQGKKQSGVLINQVVRAHIALTVCGLQTSSGILAQSIARGKTKIIGAHYDLDTGVVEHTVT
jgi:carbonic anhydrase